MNKTGKHMRWLASLWMGILLCAAVFAAGQKKAEASDHLVTVRFRLIGSTISERKQAGTRLVGAIDLAKGTGYMGAEYVTWIPTGSYTFPEGSTVYDVFCRALADAGLKSEGANTGYIRTITAPAVCGGYELEEFANGNRSGWMYTVNGRHRKTPLTEYTLSDGDDIVWHYVNDHLCECEDAEQADGQYEQYWNSWLKAEDKAPNGSMEEPAPGSMLKLDQERMTVLIGKKSQIRAVWQPSGTPANVIFSSSNPKVAAVDAEGMVTGKKRGTARITARQGGREAVCKVTVKRIPAKKVKLSAAKKTLKKGKKIKLKVSLKPKNTTDQVKWSSSNKKIARVDKNGSVKALRKGKAKIFCRAESGKKAVCQITVR